MSRYQWISLALLVLAIGIAVHSIEQAKWITPQPALLVILIMAVIATYITARSPLPAATSHVLLLTTGLLITIWQTVGLAPAGASGETGTTQLLNSLLGWWRSALSGNPAEGNIQFIVFLVTIVWMISYISAWFLLRHQNPWVATALGTILILVNLSNLSPDYYFYFFLYIFVVLMYTGQTSLAGRLRRLTMQKGRYPGRSIVYSLVTIFCLSAIITTAVWATPEVHARETETPLISTLPFKDEADAFIMNFLARVTSKQPYLASSGQRALFFGDPVERAETIHFVVTSKQPYYWRTRMYDIYTSRGWRSGTSRDSTPARIAAEISREDLSKRVTVNYQVLARIKTDVILSAGEFITTDIPVLIQTLAPSSFEVNLLSAYRDSVLSPDVAAFARNLRWARANSRSFGINEIRNTMPEDLELKSIGENRWPPTEANLNTLATSRRISVFEVSRRLNRPGDVVTVASLRNISPDQRYTITTDISTATATELARAGENYPHPVSDYYFQLPPGLPERVRQLAKNLTAEARTPYEKVLILKQYLTRFTYNSEEITLPEETDGVDYFLFTRGEGDCFYFASATAVMLRAVGVPTRLVAGYLPGEWDATSGTSIVRARDFHAWVEVYFPGYGWMQFDPTPASSPIAPSYFSGEYEGFEELMPEEFLTLSEDDTTPADFILADASGFPVVSLSLGVLVVALLATAIYFWVRRVFHLDYVSSIYARMCLLATLARLGPRPSQTPLEYSMVLSNALPEQAKPLEIIGMIYAERCFSSRKTPATEQKHSMESAWHAIRGPLWKRVFRSSY